MKNQDKYRGCMLGGAVGDALGYAVEFMYEDEIFEKYGESGITEYDLNAEGKAEISDDTQMSMFTANGLLLAATREATGEDAKDAVNTENIKSIAGLQSPISCIALCYKDWFRTQTAQDSSSKDQQYAWLNNVPDMNNSRAPGHTCISTLMHDNFGSIDDPKNNSKGCGGVMRVAPIGLYLGGRDENGAEVDRIGAEAAALTHGHDLGYIPAAALVHIVNAVSHTNILLLEAVESAKEAIRNQFPEAEHIDQMVELIDKAIDLSEKSMDDIEAIHKLGEGWVAEETLAIAIYCALKYQDYFEDAIIAAVNHSGDSDSTGAVAGNILGAYLGMSQIPHKFLENLELKDVLLELADDLCGECPIDARGKCSDPRWKKKYIEHTYKVI